MLRLSNRLHINRDPISRKKDLIAGLCQLVDGSAGSCVVCHVDPDTSKQTLVSTTEYRAVVIARQGIPLAADIPPAAEQSAQRPLAGSEMMLQSSLNLYASDVSAALQIVRCPLHGGPFTERDRLLVDLFHAEMIWVYQPDVLLTSPSGLSLSPRARQTLQHLLAGLSEKQIASKLQLSPNTVHHYVKSIHKHFSVSSRSELLARWVGK